MAEDANALTAEPPRPRPHALLAVPGPLSWARATQVALSLLVVALLCFVPLSTNDVWLHSAIGRLIWSDGRIPSSALFPFTEASKFPFHAHEWLSSLAIHFLDDWLGHDKLIMVKGLLGISLFALSWRLAYRLTGGFVASLLLAVAAMGVANYRFWFRPEAFALLFMLVMLNLLAEFRATLKLGYLAACVPLAALWANCHGSAPVALAVVAAFAAGTASEARGSASAFWLAARPYVVIAALMALAMLLNPYGARVFSYAWQLQSAAFLRSNIYEWSPTLSGPFVGSRGFWAFAVYLAFIAAALASGWRRISLTGALLLVAFGALALRTERHIAFFAFVSLYPLSLALRPAAARLDRLPAARVAAPVALAIAAGALVRFGNLYGGFPYFVPSNNFTPMLVDYLASPTLRGNVLNSYALGAELVYRSYPRLRPAIDSRADVYGENYFSYIEAVTRNEQALREFIGRYDVRYLLLQWPDFNLGVRHMTGLQRDGWRIVFADQKAVLLARLEKK